MGLIQEMEARYIINTYNRQPGKNLLLVKGEGSRVWDDEGKAYLDFVGGLAVNVIGHCHPAVVEAVREQVSLLLHASNLYYTAPQVELARVLVEHSAADRVFFANSGAEANEAAIKLARKFHRERYKIITARRSFHGRTLATVTATGQEKYHRGFEPLVEGFDYADFNDLSSFERLVDAQTAAVMVEPVQGEGGVHVADASFLQGLRRLCNRTGALLIYDEVQCGMGRTGRLWAYEHFDAPPDIFTTAKGLGGGLPIGVMLAREEVAAAFEPGTHASTFGGNPVACRAALAVLETLLKDGFLSGVEEKGKMWAEELEGLAAAYPDPVKEVRGLGFINALELSSPRAEAVRLFCQQEGLLVNAIGENIIRLLPPLTATLAELRQGLTILERALAAVRKS